MESPDTSLRRRFQTSCRSPACAFMRQVDQLPSKAVLDEIDAKVDMKKLEETLMDECLSKFADRSMGCSN